MYSNKITQAPTTGQQNMYKINRDAQGGKPPAANWNETKNYFVIMKSNNAQRKAQDHRD